MNKLLRDRYLGCLVGLAVGDALGAPVEFKQPGTFQPITGMRAGGPFDLDKGTWTDDTSMALCIAASLLEMQIFDPIDILDRFLHWYRSGYLSSTGVCFDIGNRTRASLEDFERTREPFRPQGLTTFASNGSIMRLAPIPLAFRESPSTAIRLAGDSSRLTHNHPDAIDACRYLSALLVGALYGAAKEDLFRPFFDPAQDTWKSQPLSEKMAAVANAEYRSKDIAAIHPSADAVFCLEAALWAFDRTDTYKDGCLLIVNMGDDSDTTAAVYGQLAGAFYGYKAIPADWLADLAKPDLIHSAALSLLQLSQKSPF